MSVSGITPKQCREVSKVPLVSGVITSDIEYQQQNLSCDNSMSTLKSVPYFSVLEISDL